MKMLHCRVKGEVSVLARMWAHSLLAQHQLGCALLARTAGKLKSSQLQFFFFRIFILEGCLASNIQFLAEFIFN